MSMKMGYSGVLFNFLLATLVLSSVADEFSTREPACFSRFDHDYKVIKKLAMLEIVQKELQETIILQKKMIEDLSNNLAERPSSTKSVAFSAQVSSNLESVKIGTTIVFDHVTLNIGNAYDPKHGVFTAMHDGIYVFMATLSSHKNSFFWIMKNGESVEYTFTPDNSWNTGTAAVTLQLVRADRVWVVGYNLISGFTVYDNVDGRRRYHSGFTGFLVSTI